MTASAGADTPIRLLIADDHPLFRRGLKNALQETRDITVVAEVDNGDDLLSTLARLPIDVVVLDISMPGRGALEILKHLKAERPKLPILVLSVHPEDQYAARFLRAGAAGYLTKEGAAEDLVRAIHKVAEGGKFASPEMLEKLAFTPQGGDRPEHETLSDREFQVLCLIASGQSLTEIGETLFISVKTVGTYRTRILEKLQLKSNAEIIHYAILNNLI
jgi:DNA-binding NarL/FixJ family response regulator